MKIKKKYIQLALLTMCICLVGFFLFFKKDKLKATDPSPTSMVKLPPLSRQTPLGQKEYQSTRYGFSLLYPDDLSVKEFADGSKSNTITFQNIQKVNGFQIYIVPIMGTELNHARILQDIPSGVILSPTNISLGTEQGTMFFSNNQTLGDTVEVWVIKGGLLFEITAPKGLQNWLKNILATWIF